MQVEGKITAGHNSCSEDRIIIMFRRSFRRRPSILPKLGWNLFYQSSQLVFCSSISMELYFASSKTWQEQ